MFNNLVCEVLENAVSVHVDQVLIFRFEPGSCNSDCCCCITGNDNMSNQLNQLKSKVPVLRFTAAAENTTGF